MNRISQSQKLLKHLKRGNAISSMLAFRLYGITRLSARIFELKRNGVPIQSERVIRKRKDGTVVSFLEYSMK